MRKENRPLRHTGAVLAVMGLLGTGLLTAYLDSHYTTVMALVSVPLLLGLGGLMVLCRRRSA